MKHIILSLCLILSLIVSACSSPQSTAITRLENLYENASSNSDNFTSEDWEQFMYDYAETDSILNSYEYSNEELQYINELRGRCSAYLLEGAVKEVGSELEKAIDGVGSFFNGLLDELNKN